MNKIKIIPGIEPGKRHKLQDLLQALIQSTGKVDGGGGPVDGSFSDIYFVKGCANCVDAAIHEMQTLYPKHSFTLSS